MLKQELEAIHELRKEFPNVGQRTLAKNIENRRFTDSRLVGIAHAVASRPFYSIYGAIRRFDKKHAVAA